MCNGRTERVELKDLCSNMVKIGKLTIIPRGCNMKFNLMFDDLA